MESVPPKIPNYRTVHDWVRKARGLPGSYRCPCGRQAEDWAYVGPSDAPFRTERGMPYSTDVFHYEPLCTSCHIKLDKKETCPRGHPRTVENSYIRPDTGARSCLACRRLRDANRQDRQPKGIPNVYRVNCPDCGASVFVAWLTRHVCGQTWMRKSKKNKKEIRKLKTVCKRGHEFTAENTYITPDGRRQCKACRIIHQRRYQEGR